MASAVWLRGDIAIPFIEGPLCVGGPLRDEHDLEPCSLAISVSLGVGVGVGVQGQDLSRRFRRGVEWGLEGRVVLLDVLYLVLDLLTLVAPLLSHDLDHFVHCASRRRVYDGVMEPKGLWRCWAGWL